LEAELQDVHSRYRTDAHDDVVPRFNERFLLSLGQCSTCLVVDDELNVIPVSGARSVKLLPPVGEEEETSQIKELTAFKSGVAQQEPLGPLVEAAKTIDQAKAVVTFVEAIAEKTLRSTVALTAARGRGKSAALGLAVAAAIAHGYSNIFITSPTPENLRTLFEFIFKGFDALKYDEHLDYDIIQSTNPSFNKAIVRVNVFRNHRQTIQYIRPEDAHVLGQAELVVIDEAAAIPLPLVKKLIGSYLVFMASTINGYEGTGRSLSLKLIQQLREQSRGYLGKASKTTSDEVGTTITREGKPTKSDVSTTAPTPIGGRTLREIKLSEPIRYARGDPVEKWLNALLCLDVTTPSPSRFALTQGCPHPSQCQLWAISRDTLFSYHPVSEMFLQKVMALYVASHYKNSPNDLQLMSDAPAHQLFVLLAPVDTHDTSLPEPLCVIQVALEGEISKQTITNSLSRGQRTDGDMIPQLVAMQFQDAEFASLSGGRIVRIATSPEYIKMGYGSRALELLTDFYDGKFTNLDEEPEIVQEDRGIRVTDQEIEEDSLLADSIKIRDPKTMPPLLIKLSQKKVSYLHYLGVSYGLTAQLHRFWKRAGYVPVYLRQTPQELTGEHSCVMLKVLEGRDRAWLSAYSQGICVDCYAKIRFPSTILQSFEL
jgi:N-acetyltransferase 10